MHDTQGKRHAAGGAGARKAGSSHSSRGSKPAGNITLSSRISRKLADQADYDPADHAYYDEHQEDADYTEER